MFYKNIEVDIPVKKRIRTSEPHYVYEILSRKNKKQKEKVVCVGIAISNNKMNPNEKYYEIHKEAISDKPLLIAKEFDNQVHLGASLVMRNIAKKEGLLDILESSFPGKSEILFSLVEYYLIRRDSAAQLYKYYLADHYTKLNYIPSETELSKFFNEYLDHELISEFLSKWMNYRLSLKSFTNHIDIDFDSTNRNVSSRNISLGEYGKAKVDEGLPQVNTAYFLDRETGLPIYFDIYYGSIIDMSHCQVALDKIKKIKKDIKGMIVLDRGYFSSNNLDYFSDKGFSFMCMGKDGLTLSELISIYPKEEISKPINRIYKTIYGLKLIGKPFKNSKKNYFLYLFYNEADVANEIARIQDDIEYACKFLIGKKDENENIQNTYGKRINLEYDEDKIIIKATPNYEYIENYKKEFGYFWIVSTEDDTPNNILRSYRFRDMVEKEMKYSKSLSDLDKTFARSDTAFEGKMLLGFISAIIRSSLILTLKPYFLQYSSETSQTALLELDKIKAEEINKDYILRYALTARQKQILALFGLTIKDVYKMLEDINFTRSLTPKK